MLSSSTSGMDCLLALCQARKESPIARTLDAEARVTGGSFRPPETPSPQAVRRIAVGRTTERRLKGKRPVSGCMPLAKGDATVFGTVFPPAEAIVSFSHADPQARAAISMRLAAL